MAGILHEDRTQEEAEEAEQEHEEYKDFCRNGPKKEDFSDLCSFWKAQVKHKKQCIVKIENFDRRWTDDRHRDNGIAQWKNGLKKVEDKIGRLCQ